MYRLDLPTLQEACDTKGSIYLSLKVVISATQVFKDHTDGRLSMIKSSTGNDPPRISPQNLPLLF